MKPVTLDDIAARLSLSKYSVSRALSGKPGVSERTRSLVLSAAHDLGYYHPAVRESREVSVGGNVVLLIPREDIHDSEFWMEVTSGAEAEAQRLGFGLITRPLANDALAHPPGPHRLEGVIIAGSRAREAMGAYLEAGLPATLITYPEPLERHDTVTIGDWEGGFVAARHLTELGHRHLAFVTDRPAKPSTRERRRGFGDGLAKDGVGEHHEITLEEIQVAPENPGVSFEQVFAARLAQSVPTGLFCSTDGVALTIIWALNRLGLKVPRDVSVVGFNDTVQAAQFVPKLTTLRVPKRDIGAAAMQSLVQQLKQGANHAPKRLSLPPEFILRESTGPAPVGSAEPRDPATS